MGWLSVIPVVGKLFDTVSNLTNRIADLKVAQVQAGTDKEKARLEAEARELEARRDLLIVEAKTPAGQVTIWLRNLMGLAVAIVLWKIIVWDQVLGLGFTNPLGKDVWDFIKIATGFYFVSTWFKG